MHLHFLDKGKKIYIYYAKQTDCSENRIVQ